MSVARLDPEPLPTSKLKSGRDADTLPPHAGRMEQPVRLADVITEAPAKHGIPCSMRVQLERMAEIDPEFHEDVQAWLRGEILSDLSIEALWDILQKAGYRVRKSQVGRHRMRVQGKAGTTCQCPR